MFSLQGPNAPHLYLVWWNGSQMCRYILALYPYVLDYAYFCNHLRHMSHRDVGVAAISRTIAQQQLCDPSFRHLLGEHSWLAMLLYFWIDCDFHGCNVPEHWTRHVHNTWSWTDGWPMATWSWHFHYRNERRQLPLLRLHSQRPLRCMHGCASSQLPLVSRFGQPKLLLQLDAFFLLCYRQHPTSVPSFECFNPRECFDGR